MQQVCKLISKAERFLDFKSQFEQHEDVSRAITAIERIPNYSPRFVMRYNIAFGKHETAIHFIELTTEEPDYGIEVMRCHFTPSQNKLQYETVYISECEDDTFSMSDDENESLLFIWFTNCEHKVGQQGHHQ